jgi:hypothetical protein
MVAHKAIRMGLLTLAEARTIAQVHSRKQNNWGTHTLRLEAVIVERLQRREETCQTA